MPSPPANDQDPFLPILASVISLLVLGALTWIVLAKPEPPGLSTEARRDFAEQFFAPDAIEFLPIEIDTEAITRQRAELPQPVRPSERATAAMISTYKKLGRAEITPGGDADLQGASKNFVFAGREIYGRYGLSGILGMIDATYPSFREALDQILAASRDLKIPPEQLVMQPPDTLSDAVGWAGAFAVLARRTGLVGATGELPARLEPMIEILFRYRWFNSLRGTVVPQDLLTGAEFITLNLWRLHEATNIEENRRHRYVANLSRAIPDYPAQVADAVVYFQYGHFDTARELFQKSMSDPRLRPLMQRYITLLDAAATEPIPSTTKEQ